MAKKVLVNGADGFIASHLTEYLVEQGLRVKVFIYYCSTVFESVNLLFLTHDLNDSSKGRLSM